MAVFRTLELFAGTQSFTKGVKRLYPAGQAQALTVDILPKFKPTFVADMLEWDYTIFPPEHFDIIWCSPPCTEYSSAKSRGVRDLEYADRLVKRCFEILDYYKPKAWIMENPATGLLPGRIATIRPGIPAPVIGDYCAYGASYRKRTAFWSNKPLALRQCQKDKCESMGTDGRHKAIIGGTSRRPGQTEVRNVWARDTIPPTLIDALITQLII